MSAERGIGVRKGGFSTSTSGRLGDSWRKKGGGDGVQFQGSSSNGPSESIGLQPGVNAEGHQQVFSRAKLTEDMSMRVDSQTIAMTDTDGLHEVSVTEVSGTIDLDMNGKAIKLVSRDDGSAKAAVSLNNGKKKGKWKRRAVSTGGRRFHYESAWVDRDDFQGLVQRSWGSVVDRDSMQNIKARLSVCARDFQR
ncbi:hypothetical protein LWI29_020807 [Acer saccharum]|uniref:Uncharacterized protein n=1 Tax=Acer saccharum TaxID=4024 RepID=A0AA39SDW6_ACESA|nr:hypothetical protein LWI29_020807 [Acer saccharum]